MPHAFIGFSAVVCDVFPCVLLPPTAANTTKTRLALRRNPNDRTLLVREMLWGRQKPTAADWSRCTGSPRGLREEPEHRRPQTHDVLTTGRLGHERVFEDYSETRTYGYVRVNLSSVVWVERDHIIVV